MEYVVTILSADFTDYMVFAQASAVLVPVQIALAIRFMAMQPDRQGALCWY